MRTPDPRSFRCAALALFATGGIAASALGQLAPATSIVSLGTDGSQGLDHSQRPRISSSGRYVAFPSLGRFGLVGDNRSHVFVRDLGDDSLDLVSKSPSGVPGNQDSFDPAISDDGRRVAFMSWATNLDPLDLNGTADVYYHDRKTHKTYLVSASPLGFVGNNVSTDPEMTPDGRYVTFHSQASDLVPGDTNSSFDVFRRDLLLGVTVRVSVNAAGIEGAAGSSFNSISADGRYVAFQSSANNLVGTEVDYYEDVFVKDLVTGAIEQVSVRYDGTMINSPCTYPTISADGTKVAYMTDQNFVVPGDNGGYRDIFVYDRTTGSVTCASRTSSNGFANAHVASGRMSRDGGFVVFENVANLIVPTDTNNLIDVFLRDLASGTTTLCSVSTAAPTVPLGGKVPDVASGGVRVVFYSDSNQLVPGDLNGFDDVFLRDFTPWAPYSYCLGKVNSLGCRPSMSATGQSSAGSTSGFVISASEVLNNRPGLLLYSITGKAASAFQGGTLCLAGPIGRSSPRTSGGTPAPAQDCSGVLALDFNAFALGLLGGNPFFELQVPGTRVQAQWWSRDPGYPSGQASSLSNALSFVILP